MQRWFLRTRSIIVTVNAGRPLYLAVFSLDISSAIGSRLRSAVSLPPLFNLLRSGPCSPSCCCCSCGDRFPARLPPPPLVMSLRSSSPLPLQPHLLPALSVLLLLLLALLAAGFVAGAGDEGGCDWPKSSVGSRIVELVPGPLLAQVSCFFGLVSCAVSPLQAA